MRVSDPAIGAELVVREFRADSEKAVGAATTLYGSDKRAMLSWGSNRSELLVADDQVVLRDTATGKNAQFATGTLDYITRADAVPLASMDRSISLDPGLQLIFWRLTVDPRPVRCASLGDSR